MRITAASVALCVAIGIGCGRETAPDAEPQTASRSVASSAQPNLPPPDAIPEYLAADPSAPLVTIDNVMDNDRFWPFRVELVQDFTPSGRNEPLPRIPGVLIRVLPDDKVRVDWSGNGRHEVPIAVTDLIERANRVRLGEIQKMAPNLILTIGNKLVDSSRNPPRNLSIKRDADFDTVLCVFADPASDTFPAIADELRGFDDDPGRLTLLFPQSELRDTHVYLRLRELDWTIPFVLDRLSKLYARSIAGEATDFPHLMLLTQEGRELSRASFVPGVSAELQAALPSAAALSRFEAKLNPE